VLTDFVRTSRILQIRGGLVGSSVLSSDQVGDLTKILPREQYIAKVLGSMQMPISGMMGVLTGVLRSVVTVMQAVADKKAEQGNGVAALEAAAMPAAEAAATAATEEAVAPAAPSTNGATVSTVEAAAPAPEAETATEAPAAEAPAAEAPAPEAAAAPEAPSAEAETTEAPATEAPADDSTEGDAPPAVDNP
jgi:hypothetical protein